jgi:sulfur carrier protein ThiS adenylyltransferase
VNLFLRGLSRHLEPNWLALAKAVSIGVIGAGGLGSNCAMHLVRSGFSNLVLADPDLVEASNLNRQAFFLDQVGRPKVLALRDNLLAVNPDAHILAHPERVDETNIADLFDACQAVVEAVDEARTKKLIVETMAKAGRFVVSASGLGGSGRTGRMKTRALGPNLVVVGDMTTPCDAEHPPLAPGVGMAAAMQADAVLNHFLAIHQENRS